VSMNFINVQPEFSDKISYPECGQKFDNEIARNRHMEQVHKL
jgi:hypothetical protein